MPVGRVVFDVFGYRQGGSTFYADRGDLVELDDGQYERGVELGALEPADGPPGPGDDGPAGEPAPIDVPLPVATPARPPGKSRGRGRGRPAAEE